MFPKTVSDNGRELVKAFEGLHKVQRDGKISAYRCPAGKWTIGWGSTKGVRSGMSITKAEAEQRLSDDLEDCFVALRRHVKVPLSQNQTDALISFIFNLGEGNFAKSTLLKKLNKGQYEAVPAELQKWTKARVDGVLTSLPGLVRRRAAEAAMFTMDTPLSSQGKDLMPQKVEQAAVKPLTKSRTIWGLSLAGASTAFSEAAQQVQPLMQYMSTLQYIFVALTLVGIGVAMYARFDDHKEGER
jgi:lysozyme